MRVLPIAAVLTVFLTASSTYSESITFDTPVINSQVSLKMLVTGILPGPVANVFNLRDDQSDPHVFPLTVRPVVEHFDEWKALLAGGSKSFTIEYSFAYPTVLTGTGKPTKEAHFVNREIIGRLTMFLPSNPEGRTPGLQIDMENMPVVDLKRMVGAYKDEERLSIMGFRRTPAFEELENWAENLTSAREFVVDHDVWGLKTLRDGALSLHLFIPAVVKTRPMREESTKDVSRSGYRRVGIRQLDPCTGCILRGEARIWTTWTETVPVVKEWTESDVQGLDPRLGPVKTPPECIPVQEPDSENDSIGRMLCLYANVNSIERRTAECPL